MTRRGRRGPAAPVVGFPQGAPQLRVHIRELVLHGFPPGERERIGAAVRAELARLLAQTPAAALPPRSETRPRVDGGGFEAAAGADGGEIGVGIARAVHGSLRR